MSSLGVDSPMFDYVEQIAGRTVGGSHGSTTGGQGAKSKKQRERQDIERQAKKLKENDELEQVENIQYEDNEDDVQLARTKVDPSEVSSIDISSQFLIE